MDLTVFRMFCASGIMLLVTIAKGQLKDSWRKLGQQPSLWWGLIFYGVVGLMLMHYTYFASIAMRQCGSGNGHPIYLSGDGDPLGLLSKKTPAAGRSLRLSYWRSSESFFW